MTVKQRRGFTTEFKTDAVKLVTERGYKISEASRNLGISSSVLRRWRDQIQNEGEQAFPGKGHMTAEANGFTRLSVMQPRTILKNELSCQKWPNEAYFFV